MIHTMGANLWRSRSQADVVGRNEVGAKEVVGKKGGGPNGAGESSLGKNYHR
jgi:hypothetical protein